MGVKRVGTVRVEHAHPERFADPAHGFAWIRMIGALLVIYGHSSPLAGSGELFPPEWPVQPDEGVLMGFFAMSGFQIAESWIRDPHPVRFAAKRVLRLWPPMLTVTLGLALVVGPLVTTLPVGEYFAARDTWGYVVNNAGLLTLKHELPGVFTGNPWPDAVNGSLWTLPMELLAYGGLYVLLLAGAAKQRWRWLAVVALAALVVWDRYLEQDPGAESAGSMLSVPVESLVAFLVAFAFGVVLNLYRIPLSPTAAVAALAVLVAMPNSISASFLMVFAASYAVVVAGHFWPARLTVPGLFVNGSYGVYVWGFPVQQLLAMAGIANQYLMLLCAAPIAYVLGTLSWVFVEEPTMRLRHYIAPESRSRGDRDRFRDDDADRDDRAWDDDDRDRDDWDRDRDDWDYDDLDEEYDRDDAYDRRDRSDRDRHRDYDDPGTGDREAERTAVRDAAERARSTPPPADRRAPVPGDAAETERNFPPAGPASEPAELWPTEDPVEPAPRHGRSGDLGGPAVPAPPRRGRHAARRPDPPMAEEETRPLGRVSRSADHP
nr:acyltransferase [Saccharopolyspora gloriosae]